MININKVIAKGNKFYSLIANNENSRFKSWEYCYNSFQRAYNENKNDEKTYDYLSLQLSFYLASWGMYRGSSFLLELDYKVHESIVKILFEPEYKILWETEINEDKNQDLKEFYDKLMKLIDEIKIYYRNKRDIVRKRKLQIKISDTLVSKIILGTIGCVPAYDTFFVYGINNSIEAPKTLDVKSIQKIIEYYKDNYNEFEKLRHKISTKELQYSQMKVLDSCFWQLGYDEFPIKKTSIK